MVTMTLFKIAEAFIISCAMHVHVISQNVIEMILLPVIVHKENFQKCCYAVVMYTPDTVYSTSV